jgi:hypothetical protein
MTQPDPSSRSFKSFLASKYGSIKHTSYFQVYDELFGPYVGKPVTFVEVGVLNGGSLFMWREFFGPEARIIGVELNPGALKWQEHGFEIHIGSQADPNFWAEFFKKVGPIDLLLDDGGHFHDQQIVTTLAAIPHVKDGGLVVVEDVHTSYMPDFHSPSKYTFVNFAKVLADRVNARFPKLLISPDELSKSIFSVTFYESIVSLRIDRKKSFVPSSISNGGETSHAKDFRKIDLKQRHGQLFRLVKKIARKTRWRFLNDFLNRELKRYF